MDFVFNKDFDLYEVDQVGFLNLNEAFASGVVSGDFAISDESYNQASPADMMHRPDDIFASYRQRDFVKSSMAAHAQSEQVTE